MFQIYMKKHVYRYFICKMLKVYVYKPGYHQWEHDFRNCKLISSLELITSHFKEMRTEADPM